MNIPADGSVQLDQSEKSPRLSPLFLLALRVFRDSSEHKRVERRRNARLAVTEILAEADTLGQAAPRILQAICEGLSWDAGAFWCLDPQAARLRCLDLWHLPAVNVQAFETMTRRQEFASGEGLPGRVWAGARPAWVLDVVKDSNFPRAAEAAAGGLHGAFAFPIKAGVKPLGVVEFFSREIREPDADLLEMMTSIGGQIGQFVERRRAEEGLRQSEEDLADFFENAAIGLHWVGPDGIILRANQAELDLLGYRREEYVGRNIAEFHADPETIRDILRRLQSGETLRGYEARLRCKDGSTRVVCIDSNVRRERGQFVHTRCFTRDITELKRAQALMAGEKQALELIAQGATLSEVLEFLTRTIEQVSDGEFLASVLLLDRDGVHLRHGAAPSLPPTYNAGIDGSAIGPRVGSCGTAAYLKKRVIVSDIASDPLWVDYRELALSHGLRACWSTPIYASEGHVLGTFALYYRQPRSPCPQDLQLIDLITNTASIVIERKLAEQALMEADRRKDEFLAMLAHELRNPLAPIRNAVEVLALRGDDPAAVNQAREVIDRQVRQMIRLVDDLLDVSRITRNKINLKKEPSDLAEIIKAAIETSRPLIESRHHRLTVNLHDEPLFLEADFARLAQVLINLLNNAAKYTEIGGQIAVMAERAGGDLLVSVRDTGVGIAPDVLPRIFDLFAQEERSLDRAQGGLGVGLTLVRQLVEMHGGTVEATSAGLGQGSEFNIRLPALPALSLEPSAAATPVKAQPVAAGRRRILVVDDNTDSAESLALLLSFWGHEVLIAHDGLSGIEKAQAFCPEIVLLDIGLPKLDGYSVAQRLRQHASLAKTVLIAMTGYGQEEDRRRTHEAGFHHHLVKPVDIEELEGLLAAPDRPAR